ncbi:MAG: DNA repair protein RecN [Robiginitomaculum sp.]
MLTGLSIRNVVLIEALDLSLGGGLSALTGETGAGKSIILDALGMATGARSDKGLVRAGADKALCTASFEVPSHSPIWETLSDAGIDGSASEDLLLRRVINSDGRSKAYINDQPASVKLLAAIGAHVLEVHGQHDGRGLLDPSAHRLLLDRFGGYDKALAACNISYGALKTAMERLETLQHASRQAATDRDFFEHSIAELDRLDPKTGEDASLASQRRLMQMSEGALTELTAASTALGDGDYEARLATALRGLERVTGKLGEGESAASRALSEAASALDKALIETEEARSAVAHAASAFDVEPGALDGVEQRLFALRAAARKFNTDIDGLAAVRASFAQNLYDIDNSDAALAKAQKQLKIAQDAYDKAANALTRARIKAGKALDKAVMTELPALKMDKARFETRITEGRDSASGRDAVSFAVSTNPGMPMGALDKVASGGEMSRFALAIKVALAGDGHASLIFDEVDAGVGGAVAAAVGKRLSALSKSAQVLVVTHSPQVAACADSQFLIHKTAIGDKTITHVSPLIGPAREEEIARMLAGERVTDAARAAARQLMG